MRPILVASLANDAGMLANHVLAIELADGALALVDTGIGRAAREDPKAGLGTLIATAARPSRDPETTIARQVQALGREVRHVFMTHLDSDHASGLPDLPGATVHVHRDELAAATSPPSRAERQRYVPANWAHGPTWAPFGDPDGELFGLPRITLVEDQVFALPLPGHTRGHTVYAIRDGERWLVHAGDAFYHAATVDPTAGPRPSRFLQLFERAGAVLPKLIADNHRRLHEIAADPAVTVVCTHDPSQLAAARR